MNLNLWTAVETLAGDHHVAAEWATWSGDHFDLLRTHFLRDTEKRAGFVPCPHGCGCDHRIHPRGGGKLVGICQCEPWNCEDMAVMPAEATLLALNTAKFGRAISKVFDCDLRETKLPLTLTWQIGAKFANGVPVFLTIQNERDSFRRVVAELTARQRERFILLAPTSRMLDATSKELLASARAGFFDLETNLLITSTGIMQSRKIPGELFKAFAPDASNSATDDEARRLFALLKALESESNYRKAPVTRVFQLYCLESLSRKAVAQACHCVPSLITLRLKAIEKKLGRKPSELRSLSDQFEQIADALTDSRAKRINRMNAIQDECEPEE